MISVVKVAFSTRKCHLTENMCGMTIKKSNDSNHYFIAEMIVRWYMKQICQLSRT